MHLNLQGIACHTSMHVFSRLNTSLLSKNTCIKLGLLKEGWPTSHVLAQKTDRVQKISVDRVYDKPVSHMPHAFDGNERLESTVGLTKQTVMKPFHQISRILKLSKLS